MTEISLMAILPLSKKKRNVTDGITQSNLRKRYIVYLDTVIGMIVSSLFNKHSHCTASRGYSYL